MARRSSNGRFLPAKKSTKARAPRKNRKTGARKRRSYKRNPPTPAIRETISVGTAALVGGLAAYAAVKVTEKIASPGVADVARVVVPTLIGIAATQLSHPNAQAVAAGAFGVAGGALATSIADAVVRPNPPRVEDFWIDNPPTADALTYEVNRGYTDGITRMLENR